MKDISFKAALLISATGSLYGTAQAQTPSPAATEQSADAEATSGEIIVTARRREENLQDVPVAITAIAGDALTQTGVRDGTDLVKVAPSLSVRDNAARRDVIVFELRGVSAGDVLLSQDPGVAVYVNDVVRARPFGLQGALYDLDSVQVLYGPQGTLFGRNSTAGAVLINTKKPSFDGVSGEFRAAYGNYDRRELTAAINLPIGDILAFRVAGEVKKRDGFTLNLFNGRRLDDQDQRAFRVSSLVEQGGFSTLSVVDYFKSSTNGSGNKLLAARAPGTCDPSILALTGICNNTGLFATFLTNAAVQGAVADSQAIGPRQTRLDSDTFSDQRVITFSNTTTVDVNDAITLKNIFGYMDIETDTRNDLDGSALPGLSTRTTGDIKQWSNEFQVQASFSDVDAILGVYYFKETGQDTSYSNAFSPPPSGRDGFFGPGTTLTDAPATNISKSVFGQATWRATDALSFTVGGRYTWDTRTIEARGRNPLTQTCLVFDANNVRLPFDNCSRQESKKFSDPSYTLSADYKVSDDILVYLAHRRGYRSGGFNPRGVNNATLAPFNSEKIQDFELGLKSEFDLGNTPVRFNAAAFYAKYDGIQRTTTIIINGVTATSVVNAASGNIKGGEASLVIEPIYGLKLGGNISYVDFTVGSFPERVTNSLTTPPTPVSVVLNDLTLPNSQVQFGLNATYNTDLGDFGKLSAVFNYKWASKRATQLTFPFIEPEGRVPSFGSADASLRLSEISGSPVFVGVFVENLFDETILNEGLSIQRNFGLTSSTYAPPRMYGVEIGAKF
tara:strand:- start:423 stop:2786 length:2364 start_codon:yes stop_codon:yes gene_type:complete